MSADRSAAARTGWSTRRANPRPHLKLVRKPEPREVWLSPRKLLGRALIALSIGPLTFEALATVVGLSCDELEDRAEELRGHVFAMRCGPTWIAFVRCESWMKLWELRDVVMKMGVRDAA